MNHTKPKFSVGDHVIPRMSGCVTSEVVNGRPAIIRSVHLQHEPPAYGITVEGSFGHYLISEPALELDVLAQLGGVIT